MTLKAKLKFLFSSSDAQNLYLVSQFGHANPDFLIIVADPKNDRLFATYRNRFVNGKVKALTGRKSHVIRDALKYSIFDKTIDSFIASLVETLHIPIPKANQFYQMIDGFLYAIAKSLRKKRQAPPVKSPFVDSLKNNH